MSEERCGVVVVSGRPLQNLVREPVPTTQVTFYRRSPRSLPTHGSSVSPDIFPVSRPPPVGYPPPLPPREDRGGGRLTHWTLCHEVVARTKEDSFRLKGKDETSQQQSQFCPF